MNTSALSRRDLREGEAADRGTGLVIVVLLHAAVIAALLQIGAVRDALRETAPLFVSFVAPEKPEAEPVPPAPPPPQTKPRPPTPSRLITSERPVTAPTDFVAPPAPVEDVPVAPAAVEAPAASVAAAPSAGATPRVITAVQYVRPPHVEYPMASRRLGEQGRVIVRVLIDRNGQADRVELHQPSRYPRLNEAALKAAREALYRPYSENGEPQVVWALVPMLFELSN